MAPMARKKRRRARQRRKRIAQMPARALRNVARSKLVRRVLRRLRRPPRPLRVALGLVAVVATALAINWAYQVARKPSELWFPVSDSFYKSPQETWAAYGHLFERHSTRVVTPSLLAALAQVEGSGNPVVRTYWRLRMTREPFEIFRPASSAVGMYQITDGTFEIARRYCVHDHEVVETGPWHDWRSCWFNWLYTRTVPSHAVEMTSAYLDRGVAQVLARSGRTDATLAQKQRLAAVLHLCGAGAAAQFARRGFSLSGGQRCGDHDARDYVGRVLAMQARFAALTRDSGGA
jgi:hypothetical protein